jgi:SAM-dependent methyltransferase
VFLEARLRGASVGSAYADAVAADYAEIAACLPEHVDAVLDIGCGMAGIDVLLYRHYRRAPDLRIHLFDRSGTDVAAFRYGMGAADRFYSSLTAARALLVDNGVPEAQISLWEASAPMPIPDEQTFDLVISLLSWGHHYPVETYLAEVQRRLRPGGRVILDVRRETGGEDALRTAFSDVQVVAVTGKHTRCVAQGPV